MLGPLRELSRVTRRYHRRLEGHALKAFFELTPRAAALLPISDPARHGVEVERDVAYLPDGERAHRLDLYRPVGAQGPLPTIFYVHGGGFTICSKETHWIFGLQFAKQGYLVVNVEYRLAPRHPFPAGLEDVAAAWRWLVEQGPAHGVDLTRVVVAGESAGANLATSLTLMACQPRPEPFARAVYDLGVVPRAAMPACGLLEVSRAERYAHLGGTYQARLAVIGRAYLPDPAALPPGLLELADPLVTLESGAAMSRPLPPFFVACGLADGLIDDSRRLGAALAKRGVRNDEVREYPRGPHAFHALVFLPSARACWRDTFAFLDRALV